MAIHLHLDARDLPCTALVLPAANRIIGDRIVQRARSRSVAAPAKVLAFPINHQDAVVAQIAASMMRKRSATAADACMAKALRQLTAELRRQGIPAASIRREVHAMEARVRAAVWALMFPWVTDEKLNGRKRRKTSRRRANTIAATQQLAFAWTGDDL